MRKAFRIIAKILSMVVILMIVIPLLLSIAIRVDFVQNFVVNVLADFASQKIETRVSIGHISINGNLEVGVTDFFVQDPNGRDTLLFSHHVSTKLSSLGILTGKVVLDNTLLSKSKLYLETDSAGVLNIKKITDKLKSKNKTKTGSFSMLIGKINIDTLCFRFRQHNFPEVEDGINYKNLTLNNISGNVNNLDIVNDSINMNISGLKFVEQSGVRGEKICIDKFTITSRMMLFEKGSLKVDSSYIDFKKVKMSYHDWVLSNFIHKVPMDIEINQSVIHMATVAKFTKRKRKWDMRIEFAGALHGVLSNAKGSVRYADTGLTRIENASFSMSGLPNIHETVFDIKAPNVEASIDGVYEIIDEFVTKGVTPLPKSTINGATPIYAICSFQGTINDFMAKANIYPDKEKADGVAAATVGIKRNDKGDLGMDAKLEVLKLDLSRYLNVKDVGRLTTNLAIKGDLGGNRGFLKAVGGIDDFGYKGYDYKNILLDALYTRDMLKGTVSSSDKNLCFNLNGEIDMGSSANRYNANINLINVDLVKLNLNKRDSISKLKCLVTADLSGSNIHDLVGGVLVDSIQYISNVDTVNTSHDITLAFNNNTTTNQISMKSDFMDVDFKGVMGYSNVFGYFMESLGKFMPAFESKKMDDLFSKNKGFRKNGTSDADNYYMIKVNVKESNQLTNILVPGLNVADSTRMSLVFNPYEDIISLRINSPKISYNKTSVEGVTIDCHNEKDALSIFAKINSLEAGNIYIPNSIFVGSLENNKLDLSARFSNHTDKSEAIIKTSSVISRTKKGNSIRINLMPSLFRIQDKTWSSNDSYIDISPENITFEHTTIYNNEQRLNINGIIGNDLKDKISVDFTNFNVETGKFIFQNYGYDITGFMTGNATGYALKNKANRKFESHVEFEKFNINGTLLPAGIFDSWWDDESRSILYQFASQGNTILSGDYVPKTSRYLADVKLQDFDVSLIAPFMKTIISDVKGQADIDVTLSNPNGYFAIDGVVDIPDFKGTIVYTNVPYTISGRAIIKDNQYRIDDGLILDNEGNKAPFTAYMTNEKYKKVKYNFDIHPEALLCLNSTASDNDIFYGKAYGTGRVTVNGNRNNVALDVTATTAKHSTFFMPLNDKITVSDVDFITFAQRRLTENVQRSFISSQKKKNELNTRFAVSLNLNIEPNLEAEIVVDPINGSSIKTTGKGNLRIYISPKDQIFTMNGDYVVSQGTYRFILPNFNLVDKYFTIKPGGWIHWSGDPLGAKINVDALYKLKASLDPILGKEYASRVNVECVLSLRDNLINPTIKLAIDVPDANPETQSRLRSMLSTEEDVSRQLFFLLFSNTFYATPGSEANNSNLGAAVGAATGIEFFTNQIKNFIPTGKFDFGVNYRPKGDMTSNELEVSVSAPILENKLYLDVEGSYNFMDNSAALASTNVNELSGDFYLTWVIDESGNVVLKGFSRTINTFDENQGLQESGVGVYYKADFNKFSDLVAQYKKYWAERPQRRKERQKDRLIKKEKKREAEKKK
ncbi:MAG: hypothetical protein RR257_01160 [Rikenellaceae bacterium]